MCFPPLTCEKEKLVQTTLPGATSALYGHKDDTYLAVLHTHSHLHTERCCLQRKIVCVRERERERRGAAVLAAWTVSVAMKQQLRHCYRLPPRKGGKEGGRAHTGIAGGRKQRHNLGRTGHGESESEEGTVDRGLDVQHFTEGTLHRSIIKWCNI